MLVFSKTSLQRHRISPRTPRAIYFNDDVYVGYCKSGDVLEISAVDQQLGAVFYTLDQKDEKHVPLLAKPTTAWCVTAPRALMECPATWSAPCLSIPAANPFSPPAVIRLIIPRHSNGAGVDGMSPVRTATNPTWAT